MAFEPSASAFSLPIPLWQQSPSLRVAKYESRKRKKQYDTGEDETDGHLSHDDGETTDAVSNHGYTAPSVVLSPDEAHQYRVAGLSFDEELPGGHFPHGPAKETNRRVETRRSILKQASALSPPLYTPQSAAHQGNLRLRHLAVLTSMLHRCLLGGDYIRAGRAWGLVIREHFGGRPIDVRTEDRWGIGAEILLRKDHQISSALAEDPESGSGQHRGGNGKLTKLLFTRKGFEDAKEYYETLIVLHPYQKTAPNAISALHFYLAMFGLWIYITQEESKTARSALDERDPASFGEASDDDDVDSENDSHTGWRDRHQRLAADIRANELTEADRIAGRMDGIITSPPYSDSPELLELRAMVSLWIADLLVSSLSSGQSDDDNESDHGRSGLDDDNDVFMAPAQPDSVQARRERRLAMEKRQLELAKSEEFMDKARQRRRGVSSKLESLHIDDDISLNMGVGDYVHSKENRHPQPRATDPQIQSRLALAEQARVKVPQTTLAAPVPIPTNRQAPVDRYGSPFRDQGAIEKHVHKDAFDTDVENIDESTIAATSVIGIDELTYRLPPTGHVNANATIQNLDIQQYPAQPSPSPPHQLRAGRRPHDSKWYEGLGDRALKSAGFDLDDGDDTSQLTSTAGDDEQSSDTDDQRFVPRYREGDEPLSRRLQNFWTASRRSYPDAGEQTEPTQAQSFIPVASTTKAPPASSRKVTLQRSMTTTPRTRFSPPKPSLLDQLDLTPTRRSPGITRTHSRKGKEREKEAGTATKPTDDLQDTEEGLGLFTKNHTHQDSLQSLNVFDMTNIDDLENDSSMNDPFSRRTSIRRIGTDTSQSHTENIRKRHLETDYPPEILCTKTFTELQEEPFDKTPTPKASKPPKETTPQQPPERKEHEDKIPFLLRLSEQERNEYFSKLSMSEWEECGDLLVEQFGKMMTKMKDLRHARRKTAAVFEAEVKRRHELVEEQSTELTGKFNEMRAGGVEVLRGRSP
ncbi:extracellular mutant protein 11-domain-containing protein [Aspergillus crustosus]